MHQVTAAALYILQQRAFEAHKEANAECSVSFQDWQTKKESEHPQFKYWSLVMQFQLSILQMVHSLRCENFTKYVESLTKLMPWLFALDHTHYARWLSVHIRDMTMLEHTHHVFREFCAGAFVVRKTKNKFSSVEPRLCMWL